MNLSGKDGRGVFPRRIFFIDISPESRYTDGKILDKEVKIVKRIYSLDVWKLVLAYVVAFFHFGTTVAPGPTVAVQVFFIISGFFLGKKFYDRSCADGGKSYSSWDYTLDHVKSIYPHYLFSLLAFFLYTLARSLVYLVLEPGWEKVSAIALDFYNQIPDLLLVQSAYNFHNSLNYPLWQLSALVIAGFFVYGLLCWNERLCRTLLFPAAILMIQSLLNTGADLWENYGFFYVPLLRALSPLCIGVLTYYFTTTVWYERVKHHRVAFNLAVVLSLITIFVYEDLANIFLITTPIVILGCYDADAWINTLLNHRVFRHFGQFSFAVYCNHALVARFVEARLIPGVQSRGLAFPGWQQDAVYFVLLTLYSMLTWYLVEIWKSRRRKGATV